MPYAGQAVPKVGRGGNTGPDKVVGQSSDGREQSPHGKLLRNRLTHSPCLGTHFQCYSQCKEACRLLKWSYVKFDNVMIQKCSKTKAHRKKMAERGKVSDD